MADVFTYGSLMFDGVWTAVTGARHRCARATVRGFVRRKVAGATFPGIVGGDRERDVVEGLVYFDVGVAELRLLDEFESDFYERRTVLAALADGGGYCGCEAYVVPDANAGLLEARGWDPGEFEREHLASYLRRNFG